MSNHSNPNGPVIEQFLDDLFYRADCPTSDQLLDYDLDLVVPDEQRQLKQHMELCDHCRQELKELRAVNAEPIPMPEITQEKEPQQPLLDSIRAWLRQLIPDTPIIPGLLEPGGLTPAMALRGRNESVSQQYIYNADVYRLSLRVTPEIVAQNVAHINGHIMNHDDLDEDYSGTVYLINEQAKQQESTLDEFGFFSLEGVETGGYTLLLELNAHAIWIQNLAIP